jgi:hypothetical protein
MPAHERKTLPSLVGHRPPRARPAWRLAALSAAAPKKDPYRGN